MVKRAMGAAEQTVEWIRSLEDAVCDITAILQRTVKVNGDSHPHYKRLCELAEVYGKRRVHILQGLKNKDWIILSKSRSYDDITDQCNAWRATKVFSAVRVINESTDEVVYGDGSGIE